MKSPLSSLLLRSLVLVILLVGLLAPQSLTGVQAATRTDIPGPKGSGQFGSNVTILSNGNWVVIDPDYDAGLETDVGAVYLYNGATDALISKLTGSTMDDRVGFNGIRELPNGMYLVFSPYWSNGYAQYAGAVTWCSIELGCDGVVSGSNSLVGDQWDDQVGSGGITVFTNGNYIVHSTFWDNGKLVDVGAITWCSGEAGCTGTVSSDNSLVGGRPGDHAGEDGITILQNGNYLVRSSKVNNDQEIDAGAVTWCNGAIACSGVITTTNSLIGSHFQDRVGSTPVLELANGNYVIDSPAWDYDATIGGFITNTITYTMDAGAVTWCNGETGCSGIITMDNSLIGSTPSDQVGSDGVTSLPNTNYLVISPGWDHLVGNQIITDTGAVTYCDSGTGCTGLITLENSLVGGTNSDRAGSKGITQLVNGNYVVNTPTWDNGTIADAGAVTLCNGEIGCSGTISTTNSLVGSTFHDRVGSSGVVGLINGDYVVSSSAWDNRATSTHKEVAQIVDREKVLVDEIDAGLMNAGAVTWCDGDTGCAGPISAANSLVGTDSGDAVGSNGLTMLPNGNYLVRSSTWDNHKIVDTGAVTWCSRDKGCAGTITAENSLVGSTIYDKVGLRGITVLGNNNYVVVTSDWDQGSKIDVGAITWCNGNTGCSGAISAENSLIGGSAYDRAGSAGVTGLINNNYVVLSPYWNQNNTLRDLGATTWCSGDTGCVGVISSDNSLIGSHAYDRLSGGGLVALSNSNYVIYSPEWNNGYAVDAGAVTWCDGQQGCIGAASPANSLVGSSTLDRIGSDGIATLVNGSYVVLSSHWNDQNLFDAGAATWCDDEKGCSGEISEANSLIGSKAYDRIGNGGVIPLSNGTYLILSINYDNGYIPDAGAVSWCSIDSGCTGQINDTNSITGKIAYASKTLTGELNLPAGWLIVAQPKGNLVSLFK